MKPKTASRMAVAVYVLILITLSVGTWWAGMVGSYKDRHPAPPAHQYDTNDFTRDMKACEAAGFRVKPLIYHTFRHPNDDEVVGATCMDQYGNSLKLGESK